MANEAQSITKIILALAGLLIVGFLAYAALNMEDNRSTGERIGDAIDAAPQGLGEATEQLGDRTPVERAGDAIEDAGRDMRQ